MPTPSETRLRTLEGWVLILLTALTVLAGCGGDRHSDDLYPVDRETFERVTAELEGRSFRQFHPSVDANPGRGVILDFHDGFSMWAQYARDGRAVHEWEITADGYRVEWSGNASELVLVPADPTSMQQFPDRCSDCIPTSDVSISVRHLFDSDDIVFRINDPDRVLPSPFPVFTSWTRFDEDEYFE